MRILAVEDEVILLKHLTNRIHEALPEAEILAFDNTDDALSVLPGKEPDIAFLDIAIGDMNGVDLAKLIKAQHPCCDIVFCTGYSDYAAQAFDLGASDYLLKPITKEKIEHALSLLRQNNVRKLTEQGLYIRCFGEFEVFYHGEPVTSFTKRSKELLAYLVDKAGAVCTSADISNTIFRGSSDSYFRVVKKDLMKILSDIGQEDILINVWGKLGINREKVRCDYFDYLDGNPRAVNQYKGAYMLQYDWAQTTLLD
ncbi:MAG: response regulator [Lachnospiraceae bacterium]|nr:response regulator [Lachnospiraceae bacterium]